MPKLKCEVGQCAHNYNNCCLKKAIDIDGVESKCKSDTSCLSYEYRGESRLNYEFATFDEPTDNATEVYCDVIQCVFEKGQKCYADRIVIKNVNSDNTKTTNNMITHCQTFESKD